MKGFRRFSLMEHTLSRWLLAALFIGLGMFTDSVTSAIAFEANSTVPPWLRYFNVVWVSGSLITLGGIFVLMITRHQKLKTQRASDLALRPSIFAAAQVKVEGTQHERNIAYWIVLAALVLPFNCIWFYSYLGAPVLGPEGPCWYYQAGPNGTLMVSAPGEVYPPTRMLPTDIIGDPPAQPDCESVLNTYLDGVLGSSGDRWEEGYDFALRLFGFTAGAVADSMLGGLSGGFMEDLSDVYDLFMMSFEKIGLMKEGKPHLYIGSLHTDAHGEVENETLDHVPDDCQSVRQVNFDDIVSYTLIIVYLFMFARVLMGQHLMDDGEYEVIAMRISLAMSLFQEISFLGLRLYAWYFHEIPMSILMLKNMVSIWSEIQGCLVAEEEAEEDDSEGSEETESALKTGEESAF